MAGADASRLNVSARSTPYGARSAGRIPLDVAILTATLLSIVLICFGLPALAPLPAPVGGSVMEANLPLLSPEHLLGTDLNGNDVLSRLLHGGRASIGVALSVNLIGL